MKLAGPDFEALCDALTDAFPSPDRLRRFARTKLDINLAKIAGEGNLDKISFELVEWAESKDRTAELVEKARGANPDNEALRAFAERVTTRPGTGDLVDRGSWVDEIEHALAGAGRSRSPILIALDTTREPLYDQEFPRTERHLTVTLSAQQVEASEEIAAKALKTAASIDEIVAAGANIWDEFRSAQPRLSALLDSAVRAGLAQPIAWCGRSDLLVRLRTALLIAHIGDGGADGFLSVGAGGHYLMPLQGADEARTMKHRSRAAPPTLRLVDLRDAETEHRATLLRDAAAAEIVAVVDTADADATMPSLATAVRGEPVSPTRAALAFGQPQPDAGQVGELLSCLPVVSFASGELAEPALLDALQKALRDHAGTHAISCIVAAVRAAWIRRAVERRDLDGCRRGLTWSTWSWVGLPLFAQHFGEVVPAAYPHLMDLRSVASRDWYFNRRKGIPEAYEADALARDDLGPQERFHLYLSGAGGTGKSCFLRYVHDEIADRSNTIAVWYRVDAPSSSWDNVEQRVREETVAAIRRKLGDETARLVESVSGRLGAFLREAAKRLQQTDGSFREIVVFIDQLERTFESGDEPDFERLDTISNELVQVLKTVQVGQGVRIFVASRKQYLPDFLGSSRTAAECGLEFNVLQTIADSNERVEFVRRVLDWCRAQQLVAEHLMISADAAKYLVERVNGHPLNMMLALIELLSADLDGTLTQEDLTERRPWERLFALDLQAAARDDLDWYFLLAMSHARTEIVRFEEVWWRLRMVDPRLTLRVDELRPEGLLERLWLSGYLGRTIHARPYLGDQARFVEFFHANLRDYLLRNVMAHGGSDLDIRDRLGGTPPAWRALDRLTVYAHDWEQTQQLLPSDDVRVLMEHRTEVIERFKAVGEALPPPFSLLFLRDPVPARAALSKAAMECFVFSALVHDDAGGWAFKTLFPDIEERVKLCRRWLSRCSIGSRPAVLRYLVELEGSSARESLVKLVLDGQGSLRDEVGQALADIMNEPLYAARYRNEMVAALLGTALQQVRGDIDQLPSRATSFVVAACGGDRDAFLRVLGYCVDRLGDGYGPNVARLAPQLASTSLVERWLDKAARDAGFRSVVIERRTATIGSLLSLAPGGNLQTVVDEERVAAWSRELRERLGAPLPDLRIVPGDSDDNEVELSSPRGRISTNLFFADRICVLKRQWEASGKATPREALYYSYDDASEEDVLWVPPALATTGYRFPVHTFDEAVVDWLEAHCRRSFDLLCDNDLMVGLVRDVASTLGGRLRLRMEGWQLRQVVVDLVEEGAPFAPRRREIFEELAQLVPRIQAPELLMQKLREHVKADLCRSVADESWQATTILLDQQLEQTLADRVRGQEGRTVLDLNPSEAMRLASAVRRQVLGVLSEDGRPPPVLVTVPPLRHSLARLLRRFDHRLHVLSFTELDPDLIPVPGGLISVPQLLEASS
jgi:hypothetical protein